MGKLIQFPDLMSQMPHRPDNWLRKPRKMLTPLDLLEEARWRLREHTENRDRMLEEGYTDKAEYIHAEMGVKMWSDLLIERESAAADTTLNYAGKIYAEPLGRA
ncbi:hypothetical protein SKP52_15710 [Sphingopyxis fribergensis]|uniref:Uncharacterized protein n=1 Tax=Sphingopyxis fribergensis TaxID=1515612 RepID=A0A0A7PJ38_9SPHN|nr:hypothetical protein [Sphingopyxis fribergensis]AJA10020.1 hypothetical protein SKP52_15710 [Sphingopyxis fribergensis]